MKKIITTLILIIGLLTLFHFAVAKAADSCTGFDPAPPANSKCCVSSTCSDAALGDYLYLRVYALDEDGNNIVGVPTSYTWQVISPTLGSIESPANPNITTNGQSVAKLKINFTADTASDKTVKVTATYGGYSKDYTFNILATCQSDPNLYYGIAGVKKSGDNSFQYSTAEVLSTCLNEYRLYEGDGRK